MKYYDYNGTQISFSKGAYALSDALYIQADCLQYGYIEPYASVTVNLMNSVPGFTGFLNPDLPPDFADFLESIGAGFPTGRTVHQNYGTYKEFTFRNRWLATLKGEYSIIGNVDFSEAVEPNLDDFDESAELMLYQAVLELAMSLDGNERLSQAGKAATAQASPAQDNGKHINQ